MGFWNKKLIDERVLNTQNKIYKEIYIIIMVLLLISIAIKFITIEMSLQVVLTEWIIIIVTSIYYIGRAAFLGIYSDEVELHDNESKVKLSNKNIIGGISLGFVLAIIFATNSAVSYADSPQQAIYYFILVFFISLLIYAPLFVGFSTITYFVAKKKSEQIIKKDLEEDSEGNW
ncbi:hypothetical protein GN156_15405 [bacterium LRH843]|nr:hypothetical protein [bacterium LRH843]